jgi:ribonuclease P protein subunit POP4
MALKAIKNQTLIGLEVEIVDSTIKNQIGIKGKIIDETLNTIKIQIDDKSKTLLKNNITIKTKWKNKYMKIRGSLLKRRPGDKEK